MRIGNGVSPAVAPLGACFLLPLRWECPLPRTHKRGKHPGQNLLREGGREGGGRRPSSSRVLEGNNKAQGQSAPPAQHSRPRRGGQARPACLQQQRGLAAALASKAQQVNITDQARSLPLSLPLPPSLKATIPGGGGGLRGRRQSISPVCRMAKRRWREEGRPRG